MFGLGHWELLILLMFFLIMFLMLAVIIFLPIRALLKSKNPIPKNTSSERLEELQKMKDNDLISEDEFNKKRSEILSNL